MLWLLIFIIVVWFIETINKIIDFIILKKSDKLIEKYLDTIKK